MKRILFLTTLLVLALAQGSVAAPPPEDMVRKLTEAIRKHCPDANIEVTPEGFTAKYGTIVYTLHSRSKTGEVYPQTYSAEGPNFKGFLLNVSLRDGKYEGAAVIPQTLQGPYFPTFLDAVPTEDGKRYYQVHFSYGSRLDPALKKAILEAIPRTTFRQSPGTERKAHLPQPKWASVRTERIPSH
jgi:hypothetical protein